MSTLVYAERPARVDPAGLLFLHHGRGTNELDLLPLADALDPQGRLHVVAPRAPLTLAGSPGNHWYLVPRVGYPDPETFRSALAQLAELHDEIWERTGLGPEQTVLGGFSMGSVMSYALGLDAERPVPGGVLALSGFLPRVEGWEPDLASRKGLRVFIAHGTKDQVIDVGFARATRDELQAAGLKVEYHESEAGHHIDPRGIPLVVQWLKDTLPVD